MALYKARAQLYHAHNNCPRYYAKVDFKDIDHREHKQDLSPLTIVLNGPGLNKAEKKIRRTLTARGIHLYSLSYYGDIVRSEQV